jgi:hypothetical protein
MRKTDKRKWRILYPLFFILFLSWLAYTIIHHTPQAGKVKIRTYQVQEGWGYRILLKDKVYIDQPFIPVVQGKVAFPDKRSAHRAAKLVKQKLVNHKLPALTKEDLKKLGLDHPEKTN